MVKRNRNFEHDYQFLSNKTSLYYTPSGNIALQPRQSVAAGLAGICIQDHDATRSPLDTLYLINKATRILESC